MSATWESKSYIHILLDEKLVFLIDPSSLNKVGRTDACGSGSGSGTFRGFIQGKFFHTNPTLNFTIYCNASNINSFYGLIDLRMRFTQAKSTDTQGACLAFRDNYGSDQEFVCKCPRGKYYNVETLKCDSCSAVCDECFGPSEKECYACKLAHSYNSELDICIKCLNDCELCSGSQKGQCKLCLQSHFTYWNGSCLDQCNNSYIKTDNNFKFCKTRCQSVDRYMFEDNSCADSCEFPLVSRTEGDAKFCDSPCDSLSNPYLYWNQSCLPTCPFFSRVSYGVNFCDACQLGFFMYSNGTCLKDCLPPFINRTQGGSKFCDNPCPEDKRYYYKSDESCRSTCSYPNEIQENIFCVLSISPEEAAKMENVANTLNTAETTSNSIATSASLINLNAPETLFINAFPAMLLMTKYININFPPKLIVFFNSKISKPFIKVPEDFLKEVNNSNSNLPQKFKEYKIYPSFLTNFWQQVIVISFLFTLLVITTILSCCNKTKGKFQSICAKMSLFICILTNSIAIVVFIKISATIRIHWTLVRRRGGDGSTQLSEKELIKNDLKNYEVVFQNYKVDSILQQSFMCIFVARGYIFSVIIGYFCDYPLAQACIITLLSLAMVLYLILRRPFKSIIDLTQFLMQEATMLTVKTSILALSVMDEMHSENYAVREKLGDIILGCNMAFSA